MNTGMFDDLDPSLLHSPDFKEDSVREVILLPILSRLGYKPIGQSRIIRSKTLTHPYIYVGSRKHPVTIIPDYTLLYDDKPILVLDAKNPSEKILGESHVQQAYSYAIHPEVRVKHFALCNGQFLAVFHVEEAKPLLILPFEEYESRWDEIEKHLAARFLLEPDLRRFAPDFGFKLTRIGIGRETELVMPGVRPDLFGLVRDSLYCASANCDFGGEVHCITFDFPANLLPEILSGLPDPLRDAFTEALGRAPFQASADLLLELDIRARLGEETQGTHEVFVPIVINEVMASRFDPLFSSDEPRDIPVHVFRLGRAFRVIDLPADT